MKVTDYAPRAAAFDSRLYKQKNPDRRDLIGAEIGVDVGAHAEALLTYCPVKFLFLIDPWPNPQRLGYLEGRLGTRGYEQRTKLLRCGSATALKTFGDGSLDFLYFDQEHDYDSVWKDLAGWWPKLRIGGLLGYRNYVKSNVELCRAVDTFVDAHEEIKVHEDELGDKIMYKGKL